MTASKIVAAAASGAGSGATLDVDDVFSTYLWTGTNSANTIANGIDLTEGGLVWTKWRGITNNHMLVDTERGALKVISSNNTSAQVTNGANAPSSFLSNGFTYTDNGSGYDIASWTFRKAPKFFDCVQFNSNSGSHGITTHSHNLGVNPALIIIKQTSHSGSWYVFHKNASNNSSTSYRNYIRLNATDAEANAGQEIISANSTQFSYNSSMTEHSQTHIAYLFAHNDGDGEFGPSADQDIIKCGSFTSDSSGIATVDLGFSPQWVLFKGTHAGSSWFIVDVMRGMVNGGNDAWLAANLSNAEGTTNTVITPTATGFVTDGTNIVDPSSTFIFMAVRRGSLFPPEAGDATKVFHIQSQSNGDTYSVGFPTDLILHNKRGSSSPYTYVGSRLQGNDKYLFTSSTAAEASYSNLWAFDLQNSFDQGATTSQASIGWHWKRAPGYFDVCAFSGNSTAGRTVPHGLTVPPEMVWLKCRSVGEPWRVFHKDLGIGSSPYSKILQLNENSAASNGSDFQQAGMTSSVITLGGELKSNGSSRTYIAYLFATVAGVSKVGSFSHTNDGGDTNVDCGFSSGARFVLYKQYDSSGSWYVLDSVRGIVAGNDPALLLNSNAAEDSSYDQIDPLSSGFTIPSASVGTGDYIFYAIA